MEVEVGDVVVLKSGGPHLSVNSIDAEDNMAECHWFDGEGNLRTAYIHVKCLMGVRDRE